ncbi:MAG TPA: flagellar hook capping FlgD N-terminal domain-containing protein [Syntrophales bacterium]|nr:flagellar hook capping FlgD N-terminal domain-containing protein [Syntrophales bacterium]
MMSDASINAVGSSATSSASSSKTATKSLGKDDFLKMLLAQLKNQDPLKPLDGTEFAVQLAQFSSLEQLNNMNSELKNLGVYQMTQGNAQAVSLIGKEITALQSGSFRVEDTSANLSYRLSQDARRVTVKIYDLTGKLADTIESTDQKAGLQTLQWNAGRFGKGDYTYEVSALDAAGNAVTADTMMTGTVTAVQFKDKTVYLTVNGQEIAFNNVVSVRGTTASP